MDEFIKKLKSRLIARYFNDFRAYEFATIMGSVFAAAYQFSLTHGFLPDAALVAASVVTGIAALIYIRNPKTLDWVADKTPSDNPQSATK